MNRSILIVSLTLLIPIGAYAHSGGTNADGCHTNRKTGDYHCHTPKKAPVRAPVKTVTKKSVVSFIDKNCKDFRTQKEAQRFFIAEGGPQSDRHRLDADNDGIACEDLK